MLLPTPPLPDKTRITFLILANLVAISTMTGSSPYGTPEEQIFWLGHPAHESALPASPLEVPGQLSLAFDGFCCYSTISRRY